MSLRADSTHHTQTSPTNACQAYSTVISDRLVQDLSQTLALKSPFPSYILRQTWSNSEDSVLVSASLCLRLPLLLARSMSQDHSSHHCRPSTSKASVLDLLLGWTMNQWLPIQHLQHRLPRPQHAKLVLAAKEITRMQKPIRQTLVGLVYYGNSLRMWSCRCGLTGNLVDPTLCPVLQQMLLFMPLISQTQRLRIQVQHQAPPHQIPQQRLHFLL